MTNRGDRRAVPDTSGDVAGVGDRGNGDVSGSPSSADYSVAFSPRQVAVGFAIVAGLVAIALSRRRRRGAKPTDD